MLQKINFCSIFASLVLFCLPWVDIQCSGKTQATQSGIQVVYGGATSVGESGSNKSKTSTDPKDTPRDSLGFAPLTAFALALLLVAIYFSWRGIRSGKRHPDFLATALPALALALLLLQLKSGFPAEKRVPQLLAANQSSQSREIDPGNFLQSVLLAPVSVMVADNIQVKTLPAFFYLLGTLGIPSLLLANHLLDMAKGKDLIRENLPDS